MTQQRQLEFIRALKNVINNSLRISLYQERGLYQDEGVKRTLRKNKV